MSRIAIQRVGAAFEGDGTAKHPVQYHLGDHLGTSALVVSGSGAWINREESFPYGETSLGSFGRKRYRFTGKERDEESGLSYHWHRYYSACLCRWIAADPLGPGDGPNSTLYASDNPLALRDPSGLAGEPSDNPSYPTKGSASNNLGASNHGANLEAESYVPEQKTLRTEVGFADGKEVESLSDATRKADMVEGVGEGASGFEEKGRDTKKWLGDDGKLNKSAVAADARKSVDQAADTLKESGSGLKQMQLRITTWGKAHLAKQKQHIAEWTKAAKDALKAKGVEDAVTVVGQTSRDLWKKVKAGRETIVGAMVAKKMLAKEVVEKVATNRKVIKAAAGVVRSSSKVVPLLGTAAGLYSFQAEAASGNYASAGVQLVGASEIPILAQVADFGSLAADLAWLAKELLDPEQQVEQWWYETFLK
jgi:RHS repeat-associated protein